MILEEPHFDEHIDIVSSTSPSFVCSFSSSFHLLLCLKVEVEVHYQVRRGIGAAMSAARTGDVMLHDHYCTQHEATLHHLSADVFCMSRLYSCSPDLAVTMTRSSNCQLRVSTSSSEYHPPPDQPMLNLHRSISPLHCDSYSITHLRHSDWSPLPVLSNVCSL